MIRKRLAGGLVALIIGVAGFALWMALTSDTYEPSGAPVSTSPDSGQFVWTDSVYVLGADQVEWFFNTSDAADSLISPTVYYSNGGNWVTSPTGAQVIDEVNQKVLNGSPRALTAYFAPDLGSEAAHFYVRIPIPWTYAKARYTVGKTVTSVSYRVFLMRAGSINQQK